MNPFKPKMAQPLPDGLSLAQSPKSVKPALIFLGAIFRRNNCGSRVSRVPSDSQAISFGLFYSPGGCRRPGPKTTWISREVRCSGHR